MKHIFRLIRVCIVAVLLLVTVSTAYYRINQGGASETMPSLSQLLGSALSSTVESAQNALGSVAKSAAGAALDAVVKAEDTGEYNESGEKMMNIQVPSGTVPAIREAASQQYGGTVTTGDIVNQLSSVPGVTASQNEDGSLSVELPEGVYESYKDQISAYLGG